MAEMVQCIICKKRPSIPGDEDLGPEGFPSCAKWACQLALHRAICRRIRRSKIISALRARKVPAEKLVKLEEALKANHSECARWEAKLAGAASGQ